MTPTEQMLSGFEPITLKQMDKVKLLNRMDTKYLFNEKMLPSVLLNLSEYYRILEIDGRRAYPYETLYFDNEKFTTYIDHHNGKLNRHKIRFRKYVASGQSFFEIKFKNNKKRTIKTRIEVDGIAPVISGPSEELLLRITPFSAMELMPKLTVNYSRITFVNKKMDERVTIDIGLAYHTVAGEKSFDKLIIAEIKQNRAEASPFSQQLHALHINRLRISKYCLGVLSLYEGVKKNNFKPKILAINRILS